MVSLEFRHLVSGLFVIVSIMLPLWKDLGGVKLGGAIRFPSKEDLYERLFQTGQEVEVRLQGKRHTSRLFKTKAAARQAEAKTREELENPAPVVETPTDMAFSALANEYLDHARRKIVEKTYKYKAYVYQQFLKFAGDIPAREITIQRIEAYLRTRPTNINYNRHRKDLCSLFPWAYRRRILSAPEPRFQRQIPNPEDVRNNDGSRPGKTVARSHLPHYVPG